MFQTESQRFSLRPPFAILQLRSSFFLVPWPLLSRHYCFHFFGCHAALHFSPPFLILAAIFIAVPFSSLPSILSLFSQTAIISAFHSRLDLSCVGSLFLLWSCHCSIHLAAKETFVVTTDHHSFAFLVVVFSSFSHRCSHGHGSTDSSSHTVVLPSLHPTLQHCSLSP